MLSTFFYKPIHLAQRSESVLYCTCALHSTFARPNVSLADFLSVGKACYVVFFLPLDIVRIMQLTVQLRSLRSVSSLVKLNNELLHIQVLYCTYTAVPKFPQTFSPSLPMPSFRDDLFSNPLQDIRARRNGLHL